MAQNHKQQVFASASRGTGTVTQVLSNNDSSGCIIVIDSTTGAGAATFIPSITITGDADTTSGILYTGATLTASGGGVGFGQWYIYPQGLDTVAASFKGTDRTSLSLPNKFTVSIAQGVATATWSCTIYWLN